MRYGDVWRGSAVLQRQLRYLHGARRELHEAVVRCAQYLGERAVRAQHLQRWTGLLQRELRYLLGARSVVRPGSMC